MSVREVAMPHSLEVRTPPSPGSKRQRSADRRDMYFSSSQSGKTGTSTRSESPAMPVKMPAFLNKSRAEIHTAFEELNWNQRFRLQDSLTNPESPFKIDRTPAVTGRNRYTNIQPWDASRIKLRVPIGGSDYVNASPIRLRSLGSPSLTQKAPSRPVESRDSPVSSESSPEKVGSTEVNLSETSYIATQGPQSGQFSHFWHMVMQQTVGDVGVIVMLTTCYEGNSEKCAQYFPASMDNPTLYLALNETGEVDMKMKPGDRFSVTEWDADAKKYCTKTVIYMPEAVPAQPEIVVTPNKVVLLSMWEDATTGCEVRKMRLEIGEQSKTIYHYLFSNWPDFGKPEAEDRKALLELVKQSAQRAGRPNNPRFVHCSAGVGRTGTFIALDHLLQELENGNLVARSVNADAVAQNAKASSTTWGRSGVARESTPEGKEDLIYNTVDKLREQRMMMVMNELQLCFLYEVVKEAFIEKYSRRPGQSISEGMALKVPRLDDPTLRNKAAKEGRDDDGGISEAETEVMEGDDHAELDGKGEDPYAAVAPENVQASIEKAL